MNTTLNDMKQIEAEAQKLAAQYQTDIQQLYTQLDEELEQVKATYDNETETQVAELTATLTKEHQALDATLQQAVVANQQQVGAVLNEQKDRWVDYIVEKVVKKYGH